MPSRNRSAAFNRPSAISRSSVDRRRRRRFSSSPRHLPQYLDPKRKEFSEWDEILCPACMEPPHNAALLLCSSNKKGCRPFMCNTGVLFSNCLTKFCKGSNALGNNKERPKFKLSCPLCRGAISGCKTIEAARIYMNEKLHSCSAESCDFTGVYLDLVYHSITQHLYPPIPKDDC